MQSNNSALHVTTRRYDRNLQDSTWKIQPTRCTDYESSYITRGNDKRLQKSHVKYDLRKYCFTNRMINMWNSQPDWVVSANNTNIFNNR